MNYYVYIVKNSAGKIYVGQTYDISKRMAEHNELGKGFTSKFRPWKLIYSEIFLSRKEAMAREKYLKTGTGRDWIKNNVKDG
ncbi:GIY-YIG nuclease family protein [Candidatus Parcubacteria bacterium]|nr:MAG: GIY-YIG nuclease family protein [Candidatus Parcubacteria bacterium]